MRTPARSAVMVLVVAAAVSVATPALAVPPASAGTYVVQDGDILYAIATRAGVTIDALLKANDLKLDTIIIPGQKLAIPVGGHVPSATPTPVAPPRVVERAVPLAAGPGTAPAPTPGGTYVVQPGDAILALAFRFGVSPDALMKLNKLTMDSVIVIGQKLVLPADAKVQTTGNARVDTVVGAAKAQLGKPYKFGYAGPDFFDCSGLVRYAFARVGMNLLHNTLLQKNAFPAVSVTDLHIGDLVFFHDDYSHEGMYLGNGLIIHAPSPGQNVMISWVPLTVVTGAVRPIS